MDALSSVWWGMMTRCYNKNDPGYQRYGARGIRVCRRWHKFPNFAKDMGRKPRGSSIDRIDNNGPYSPKNCRWASKTVQAQNRRNTRWLIWHGHRRCIAEWARLTGIADDTLRARIKRGVPFENLFLTSLPSDRRFKLSEAMVIRLRREAKYRSLAQLAREHPEVCKQTLWDAITGKTYKHLPSAVRHMIRGKPRKLPKSFNLWSNL